PVTGHQLSDVVTTRMWSEQHPITWPRCSRGNSLAFLVPCLLISWCGPCDALTCVGIRCVSGVLLAGPARRGPTGPRPGCCRRPRVGGAASGGRFGFGGPRAVAGGARAGRVARGAGGRPAGGGGRFPV